MSVYEAELFRERDFLKKKCVDCGRTFWTLDPERKTCGDTPCDEYSFIDNPPISKEYNRTEMEEEFLSFFEDRDHSVIPRYPVVARWRDDIHLTIASIADFQPWVTSGEAPPPANPLVISQPSIRLNDIDNVGRSGRHFTLFFMGGHHAFNSEDEQVYWNDETVALCQEFLTEALGIDPLEITYVEDVWEGGGNAGEDLEVNVRGLELSTLVFMHYGFENGKRYELPLKIVDTGYGIERFVWASQGTPTSYEAVFGPIVPKLRDIAGVSMPSVDILKEHSKLAGMMDIETGRDLGQLRSSVSEVTGVAVEDLNQMMIPLENVYAIADHLRCLAFMFGDGITPSNESEGYLSRLVLRRTLRLMQDLDVEEPLVELMDMELKQLTPDFPELKKNEDYILEVVDIEEDRYRETLEQGRRHVRRLASRLKKEGSSEISTESLIELYDSHGLPPEMVKEVAEDEGVEVESPEDFYIKVAESHSHAEEGKEEGTGVPPGIDIKGLPKTETLYYSNSHQRDFDARVLQIAGNYVVLDRTAFYPEGGGQPADEGVLRLEGEDYKVLDVQKHNGVILHEVDRSGVSESQEVKGELDWEKRSAYMRHHTATHILLGALRHVLGDHVFQHGAQKGEESSRFDVTHFERISDDELREIERVANRVVLQNRDVNTYWMERNKAEQKYGHSLYQGGVVPGREIRVVDIEDWNAQACAGTHCKQTGEVGLIKIIDRERIQDGVERLIFASGEPVLEAIQERDSRVKRAAETLRANPDEIDEAVQKIFDQWKSERKKTESLRSQLAELYSKSLEEKATRVGDFRVVSEVLESGDADQLIEIGERLIKGEDGFVVILGAGGDFANFLAMAGEEAVRAGVDCGKIASEAAKLLGGGGGGRPQMAQGGGERVDKLHEAVEVGVEMSKEQLGVV